MGDLLLRMLILASLGLLAVLLVRHPARRVFGAGPAFSVWLLPPVLALAPLLPRELAPAAIAVLPVLTVTPHATLVATTHAHVHPDWAFLMIALWLAGTAIGFARLAWHYARLRSCAQHGSDAWLANVQAAAPGLDLRRVRMHTSGPAVLWAPRSLILLPEDFAQRFDNAATREVVLCHELTHIRRGDAWWTLLMEILSALLWFHPLAWLARSRFRLDQELACDAASLRVQPSRTTHYVRALVDSVAMRTVPALIPWLAEPQLKERIAMITRIPPGALRRRAGFVAIAALLTAGLLVAGGQAPVEAATQVLSASKPPSVDVAYKNEHPPVYPFDALRKGEQGTVVLDVTVDAFSKLTAVRVDPHGTTAPTSLQESSIAAAKDWRYNPGSEAGKPVGGVIRIPVMYSLAAVQDDAADVVARNPPAYPINALRNHEQGMVMLRVRVSASGSVTKVLVDKAKSTTTSAELQAAAVTAAEHWKLKPASKGGKSVAGWQTIPVNFTLDEGEGHARTPSTRR